MNDLCEDARVPCGHSVRGDDTGRREEDQVEGGGRSEAHETSHGDLRREGKEGHARQDERQTRWGCARRAASRPHGKSSSADSAQGEDAHRRVRGRNVQEAPHLRQPFPTLRGRSRHSAEVSVTRTRTKRDELPSYKRRTGLAPAHIQALTREFPR